VSVLKAHPVTRWPPSPDTTFFPALSATQLNATVGGGITGTFAYTPIAGTVLNAGSNQTLSVTFTPTDTVNVSSATKTVTISVLKLTPTITWATPADITYGTALGAAQLNATVGGGVTGTFAYTPLAGAVLNAGSNQTLSVTFTPTDPANAASATKTAPIDVLKRQPLIASPH